MTFEEFLEQNNQFSGISINDQVCRTAWFVHRFLNKDRFSSKDISDQFRSAHINPPQTSVYLPRLAGKKPAPILLDKRGYFLEGRERKRLDGLLSPKATTAKISDLLRSLTNLVTDGPERVFLDEAIRCYEVTAFRAAIVMIWNLAYDHLRTWILADEDRLKKFNDGAAKRFTKSSKPVVINVNDFDDFTESQFLDACNSGKIMSKNLENMLREKLRRRNMAAHPSSIVILQPQADDVITDLVRNVILDL